MKKLESKSSKNVILGILVVVVIVRIVTGAIILNRDNKPKEEKKKESIILNDNLEFEINSEVKLLSLVSDDNKVKIVSEDEIIDTSSLGEKEITIKYLVKDKEEAKTVTIKIVDTQAPTIEYNKELSTNVGTKIDLLKNVKVSDNSKEKIKATVEGEYDLKKEGTYKLKYVAKDSSNNITEKEFTLKVNKKTTATKTTKKVTKPQANNNVSNTNSSEDKCPEYLKMYSSKNVYTSIPNDSSELMWNVAKFYVTEDVLENGVHRYTMHNEKISGHYIGKIAYDSIMEYLGDLSEMKYTKDNPLILYQLAVCDPRNK